MERKNTTLILAPHCDDVALSLGASLSAGFLGRTPHVSVLFSRSRYTKDFPGNGPENEITEIRNREEIQAASLAGYSVEFCGFGEPSVRLGYPKPTDIFDPNKRPIDDQIWLPLCFAIDLMVCNHLGLILAPLGCGRHIDHLMLREAFVASCDKYSSLSVGFYEDLPYCNRLTDEQILQQLPSLPGRRLIPRLITDCIEQKRALVQIYRSQRTSVHLDGVDNYWARRGGERLWLAEKAH